MGKHTPIIRDDISSNLVHLSRDRTDLSAAEALLSILKEGTLRGSDTYIKGGYTCVCFSETPIGKLAYLLAELKYGVRYKPFGIMVPKKWLFDLGGRPVIYQSTSEFELLSEEQRFRHVIYEPDDYDFTWEREWRIKIDKLPLDPNVTTIVLPNRDWEDWLLKQHGAMLQRMALGVGLLPRGLVAPPWHYFVLEDLGVPMMDVDKPPDNQSSNT